MIDKLFHNTGIDIHNRRTRVLLEMNCQTTGITVGVLTGVVGVAVGMSGLIGGAVIVKRHVDR